MTAAYPSTMSVREALARYRERNGFTPGSDTAPTFTLAVLGLAITLPNPPSRQCRVGQHDLHHLANGYATDYPGEGENAIWELLCGCTTPMLYVLNGAALAAGLFSAPLRVLRAGRRALGQRTLYRLSLPADAVMTLNLGELRALLGIPLEGNIATPDPARQDMQSPQNNANDRDDGSPTARAYHRAHAAAGAMLAKAGTAVRQLAIGSTASRRRTSASASPCEPR